jgi:hypothetical protein
MVLLGCYLSHFCSSHCLWFYSMLLGDICHVTYGVVQMLFIMLLDVAHG